MSHGFMGKILHIRLNNGEVFEEEIRQDWAKEFLGGAGLATRYLYEYLPRYADPLGSENPLIFMTGPLTGTASASASRYSVVAKSPLTGIWGQSNSGGNFGPALKKSGFDGLIFEGVSPVPVYLFIHDGIAELRDAQHLWGKNVSETDDLVREETYKSVTVACIGPAGENLVRYAAIMNNKHRAAGRTGMGAVMGSKRLKAIACTGSQPVPLYDPEKFQKSSKRQYELMDESILKIGFDTFGTNMLADMVNVRGGYPTLNWQEGSFAQIDEVNAQALNDKVLVDGVRCFACPVSCGRGTEIREGKWHGHRGEGPEYETTDTLGPMCGISDINTITMANYRCNELGLDTISAGSTIAFAMECFSKGILTSEQTEGLEINFGDGDLLVNLIEKIAFRDGIGDWLAEGSRFLSRQLGQGSEQFAMQVKGLELPAYDPRAAKITGIGYVTANRGGDHMTGYIQGPTFFDIPFLIVEESSIRDPFVANPAEIPILVDMEDALTLMDCIGGCKFMGIQLTCEDILELFTATTGMEFTVEEFRRCGERVYNLERVMCVYDGVTRQQDTLPGRLLYEPLPDGPAQGMVIDPATLEMMKDAYYERRGWDCLKGIPSPEKLSELGLEELATDLWPLRTRREIE